MNNKKRLIKLGTYCGIISIIFDIIIVVYLGSLAPSYNHLTQYISELGNPGQTPYAWLMNVWWTIYTVLKVPFVIALYLTLPKNRYRILTPLFIGLDALGNGVLSAIFSCGQGCMADTMSNNLHTFFSGIGMVAANFAPIAVFLNIKKDKKWQHLKMPVLVIQVAIMIVFACVSYHEIQAFAGQRYIYIGLLQRLHILVFYLFLYLVSINLLKA